ncbi:MAG TPA: type VI secretion system baseplate subunit TssG [Verrucomicrobiae bacterium]|jgi:type VI secretion system protein ImpH|nr:type VI secretion system baseplate subunit TssG [Verrucomicrobiae bacterium]
MADPDRKTPDNLVDELAKRPFSFDFFRAVRLLENRRCDLPRVGCSLSPAQDVVRFGQTPSLAFSPSTLESVEKRGSDGAKFFVRFFGLFGPNAPLPPHLTEYAHDRKLHHGDRTLQAFMDVFHHRLISFFYRAWATNQKTVDLDRQNGERFSLFVGSVFGLGGEAQRNRDSIPDWAKLHFAGRLATQVRSAEGLEFILREYFEVPAELQTFVGHWMDLPADSICKLGETRQTGTVGANAIVGLTVFDAQLKFRIRLGPMKYKDYERLLPGGTSFERIRQWVLNYCGEQYFWDVQLVLEAEEVPSSQLGKAGRLGWTTWLKSQPFTRDADDIILVPS